tara:strand:- start:293 stop:448 length:156 start_codon:yes stop_codon:yes gene_type:complete
MEEGKEKLLVVVTLLVLGVCPQKVIKLEVTSELISSSFVEEGSANYAKITS